MTRGGLASRSALRIRLGSNNAAWAITEVGGRSCSACPAIAYDSSAQNRQLRDAPLRHRPKIAAPFGLFSCPSAALQKGLHILDMRPFWHLATGQDSGATRPTYFGAMPNRAGDPRKPASQLPCQRKYTRLRAIEAFPAWLDPGGRPPGRFAARGRRQPLLLRECFARQRLG